MPLHSTVSDIGNIWDDLSGLFGGRSAADIRSDELASMASNKTGFFNAYGIILPDTIVIGILRPGWNRGDDGTQLWQRMKNFYNTHKTELERIKGGTGGDLTGGGGVNVFDEFRRGDLTGGGGLYGFNLSSPIVLIVIGVVAFLIFRK